MSMSTEQAMSIIDKLHESKDTTKDETKVESTPSVEETKVESKSEESTPNSPEDKVESNDNKETKAVTETKESKESDESKQESVSVKKETDTEPNKEIPSKFPEMSKRDYAFIREKQKRKEMKAKYEARIKELEEELNKKRDLEPEHFKNQDGTLDPKSYVNWKFKERDLQDEIKQIQAQDREEQYKYDLERDRIVTERCFPDEQERKSYQELISNKGKAFAEAVSEIDKNGVVFSYLETLSEYPIVLRELMDLNKNPNLLQRVFRSSDPESLKHNIAYVADEILNEYHKPHTNVNVQPNIPQEQTKPAIPVIGKQITNQTTNVEPVVKDRNYWSNYLKSHPRGR